MSAPPETAVHPNFNEKTPVKRFFGPASYAFDGDNNTGWSSDLGPGRRNYESVAVFAAEKPLEAGEYTIRLVQNIGGWNSDDLQAAQLGRFRLSFTTAARSRGRSCSRRTCVRRSKCRASERSPAQVATIFSHWRTTVPEWKEVNARIEELWKQHPEGATQFTLEVPRRAAADQRAEARRLAQAGQGRLAPACRRSCIRCPMALPTTRLTLAHWLVDRRSPTTARSFVNRVWQAYFGTGIVGTSEDLGTQSEAPSHPELLDWLAVEFMEPTTPLSLWERAGVRVACGASSTCTG